MSAAFKTSLSSTHKFVFVALCDNANDQGECFPSVSMLAEKTSLSDRAVQKSITYLCDMGFIMRNARNGRSTYYTVTAPHAWPTLPPNEIHPRTTFTPNNVHPTPEQCSPPPPNVVHPTPEPRSPITIKEPSIESSKEPSHKSRKVKESSDLAIFDGVDAAVLADYKTIRKAKKLPITQTAMDKVQREAEKAGLTLEGALRVCCERGWAGFEAEWVTRSGEDRRSVPRDAPDRRANGRRSINDFGSGGEDDDPFNGLKKEWK